MKTLTMTLCGDRPLLQHNVQLVDPLNEYTQRLRKASDQAKSSKTDEAYREMALVEFEGGLYYEPEIGPFMKAEAVERCFREAAAKGYKGTGEKVRRGVLVTATDGGEAIPLLYPGPREINALKADQNFHHRAAVKIGQQRVMRTRPKFTGWKIECIVMVDEKQITTDRLMDVVEFAGEYIGLGDHRPRYGRFTVEA